jgi:glycosyltransferase involved in cell wall biosynthesis
VALPSSERINVLYVIWSLQTGGAERVVADLARVLDRTRFRPMVCCLNFKGRLAEELEAEGIPVFALDKKPKLDPGVLFKLVALMRREKVDVVHTHLWTSSFWGRLAASIAGVPVVVVTEHNLDLWRRAPHFLSDRLLGRWTDAWIFVSREVDAFYRARLPGRGSDFHTVHNGVDLASLGQAAGAAARVKQAMGLPAGTRVVGVVGRLEARKGHRFFLEAMKTVLAEEPDTIGVVIGEGKERAALALQHEALGLQDGVRLVGYWASVAEALSVIDVFVLPSLMEGHPIALLEAMAAGKAVVATSVGGNGEAVADGVTGLLVPPADPAALAEATLALLRDPARAARMGEAGRAAVRERFSLEAAVRANEQIYLDCLQRQGKGARRVA